MPKREFAAYNAEPNLATVVEIGVREMLHDRPRAPVSRELDHGDPVQLALHDIQRRPDA